MTEHRAREGCRRGEAVQPAPAVHPPVEQRFRVLQLWAVLDAHLLCAAAGIEGWTIDGVSVQLPPIGPAD
ncbi:hypothetical protein [Actinocrispum sp. NPDC049592]|uniref:hypothetical protein n=1 Tax=Actinocrispum sp. NPDC049592 TaxID=3154835 RepID=UPI0034182E84